MKLLPILGFTLLACSVAFGQEFNPEHKYAAGSSTAYSLKLNATTSVGDVLLQMDTKETIKKVYPDGNADIETVATKVSISLSGGETRPGSKPDPNTSLVDRYGRTISFSQKGRSMMVRRIANFYGDKPLKVGETQTVDEAEKDNPKSHVLGTVKLVTLTSSRAELFISVDSFSDEVPKPAHVEGTATVDAKTGRLIRFEGKATNLHDQGSNVTVPSATFTLEKK